MIKKSAERGSPILSRLNAILYLGKCTKYASSTKLQYDNFCLKKLYTRFKLTTPLKGANYALIVAYLLTFIRAAIPYNLKPVPFIYPPKTSNMDMPNPRLSALGRSSQTVCPASMLCRYSPPPKLLSDCPLPAIMKIRHPHRPALGI